MCQCIESADSSSSGSSMFRETESKQWAVPEVLVFPIYPTITEHSSMCVLRFCTAVYTCQRTQTIIINHRALAFNEQGYYSCLGQYTTSCFELTALCESCRCCCSAQVKAVLPGLVDPLRHLTLSASSVLYSLQRAWYNLSTMAIELKLVDEEYEQR